MACACVWCLLSMLWSCVLFWRVFRDLGPPGGMVSETCSSWFVSLLSVRTLGLRFKLGGGVLGFGHRALWFELALCEYGAGDRWWDTEVQQSREDVILEHFFFTVSDQTDYFVVFSFSVVMRDGWFSLPFSLSSFLKASAVWNINGIKVEQSAGESQGQWEQLLKCEDDRDLMRGWNGGESKDTGFVSRLRSHLTASLKPFIRDTKEGREKPPHTSSNHMLSFFLPFFTSDKMSRRLILHI